MSQATGLLSISSPNKTAAISITQINHQAKVLGRGSLKVHLLPGVYQISATDNTRKAFASVEVFKKQTTKSILNPTQSPMLPSTETIHFEGSSAMINYGLTAAQISNLKLHFFTYKPTAQSVAINTSSIKPAPRNPDVDIGFKTNFSVVIDSTTYNATISYDDLDHVRLFLHDPVNNSLVFDSGASRTN